MVFWGVGEAPEVNLSAGSYLLDAVVSDASFRGDVQHLNVAIDPNLIDLIFMDGFD